MDEVRNGLYYFETTLFDLAPEIERSARARRWRDTIPGARVRVPRFLRFGSWIGGDRDGNPFVTVAATEETLREHQELALRLLPARARAAARPPEHGRAARGRRRRSSRASSSDARAVPRRGARRRPSATARQPYRQKLRFVYRKLGATLEASARPVARRPRPRARRPTATPRSSSPTCGWCRRACARHRGERLADGPARDARARRPRSSASTSRASTCASTRERHTRALAEVLRALRPRRRLRGAGRGAQRARS